ncbi:MAG: phospholipid carrier-dependent glycosyltransferase, partial [Deltaproteobacteria bacterium]|nr:phospholipid carrier-dependent glycosyltransferase [Deltaproteobacteria bacterium]
ILFGLSWRLLGRMAPPGVPPDTARRLYRGGHQPEPLLGLLPEAVAFRLPGALSAALLVGLIYLFGRRAFGRRAGLGAALAFILLPRAWFDAHLAAFDMPITLMWFVTLYAFWRSLDGGWGWALATAGAFGLALSTKHNSWFLPFVCGLVALIIGRGQLRWRRAPQGSGLSLPVFPISLLLMLVIGPLLAWALWPRLWFDTISRVGWYLGRHLHHEFYWAYFFGTLYTRPPFPWYFPWAMTAVTVPVVTLALAALGSWRAIAGAEGLAAARFHPDPEQAESRRKAAVLLLVNFVFPIAVFCTTRTPIFGGTKHWLPAMPYLALLAGLGFAHLCRHVEEWGRRWVWLGAGQRGWSWAAQVLLGLLLALPAAFGLARAHPSSCTYYNELLGGPTAMGEFDLQREFWGNSSRPVLPWLNENLPPGTPVFFQDTNEDSVLLYKRDGLLRHDIRSVGGWDQADYTLFHHHKEFLDSEFTFREKYGDPLPVTGVYQEGVPLLEVYRNTARWRDR